MSSASKVGEIFAAAGTAFTKLGELTKQLNSPTEHNSNGSKWTDHEIEMLQTTVNRFSEDLYKLTEVIKSRTLMQTYDQIKKKAHQDIGLQSVVKAQGKPPMLQQNIKMDFSESETSLSEEEVNIEELELNKVDLDSDDYSNLI